MNLKKLIKKAFQKTGYTIHRLEGNEDEMYIQDGLRSVHNHDFMTEDRFRTAFHIGETFQGNSSPIDWRLHTILWAAQHAAKLEGDFVECGVFKGFYSAAVMYYLQWNDINWADVKKRFFLIDTFTGTDRSMLTGAEEKARKKELAIHNEPYNHYAEVTENFITSFSGVHVIQGSIPDILPQVHADKVAYLSIDMNCAYPEICAAEHFWDKMVKGAVAVLDDYAYVGYIEQKKAFDDFAKKKGVPILSLPTGQGIYIKE